MSPKTGVLLINLGSPDAPTPAAVRRYLRQLLGDPRVLPLSALGRALLLNLIILPFRPRRSAHAYRSIWTPAGSPLLLHADGLKEALAAAAPHLSFAVGMRCGHPSLAEGLAELTAAGCTRILLAPLYPQYASGTTGSAIEAAYQDASRLPAPPGLAVLPPFYDAPGFLDAWAAVARPLIGPKTHVLLSFHGLPEKALRQENAACLTEGCCERPAHARCYRAHCLATARGIVARLGLAEGQHTVSFQSRLGRTPWLSPYTEQVLATLPAQGHDELLVLCPSFVADCLETLEELGQRGAAVFKAAGGARFTLAPSLNTHPQWVSALLGLIKAAL